jgi:hypothetical protein
MAANHIATSTRSTTRKGGDENESAESQEKCFHPCCNDIDDDSKEVRRCPGYLLLNCSR